MRGLFSRRPSPRERYAQLVANALADAHITDSEAYDLQLLRGALSEGEAREVVMEQARAIIERRLYAALEDGSVSPEEDRDIADLSRALRIDLSFGAATQAALNRARQTWQIANLPLPDVGKPCALRAGEVAHAVETATAYEERTRTTGMGYAGPAISIPIIKGVRYRIGHVALARQQEAYDHVLGRGPLIVTSRRLIFLGDARVIETSHAKIFDMTAYTDGLRVVKTGKPITFLFDRPSASAVVAIRAWSGTTP